MKRYVSFPIAQLVSDVPIDSVHTRELVDSIMSRGQLAPVIIREETKEVIDGFHRIAAMKELGFTHVECVLTPCDDEGFWDFRIIEATTHKNITFARAIDWIEKVFELSSLRQHGGEKEYKNLYSVFTSYRLGNPPKEVKEWVEAKSAMWSLAPHTIEDWLYTKRNLSPELLKEASFLPRQERGFTAYRTVARVLPTKPELQKRVMEKAKAEDLSGKDVEMIAQALRRAEDEYEVASILRQPVSRTEDQMVREAKVEKLLSQPRKQIYVPLPEGKYRTIVIDPPWPIEKILREVRPNQLDLDYSTMTLEEIEALPVPELAYEDSCHIYLWTTHKYLPRAFEVLDAWGANYECLLTWVKNVGITPFSWMYSTEHCLFARIGNLPLLKLGKRLDFQAKVREHSRKPDEFYNLVKEVSPEPRIDMFSREKREGFAQYGNEPGRFSSKEVSVSH